MVLMGFANQQLKCGWKLRREQRKQRADTIRDFNGIGSGLPQYR